MLDTTLIRPYQAARKLVAVTRQLHPQAVVTREKRADGQHAVKVVFPREQRRRVGVQP
jgi:hypothetical protein